MPITPYVGAKIHTGTPQLQRFVEATATPLGTAAGTAVTYGTNIAQTNPFLKFGGAIYWAVKDDILRSYDDGLTWQTVYTFSPTARTDYGAMSGPYVTFKDGSYRLVVLYRDTAADMRCVVSSDGTNWVNTNLTSSFVSSSNGLPFRYFPVVYRQYVVWFDYWSSYFHFLDPHPTTPIVTSMGQHTGQTDGYLVVWNDQVHAISRVASATSLVRVAGGVVTPITTIHANNYTDHTVAAWVDPATNELIAIAYVAGGFKAFSISAAGFVTDITASIITGTSLASYGSASRVRGVIYDQDQNAGTAPDIYLMIASGNTAGTAVSMWKYNGVSTLMGNTGIPNDSGGDVAFAYPDKNWGGERFFTPRSVGVDGTPEIHFTGRGGVLVGSTLRKFKTFYPRSDLLTTLGGSGAYDLSSNSLDHLPVQPGSVTIKVVIGTTVTVVRDDGVGNFPSGSVLPSGGTIDYTTGAMTGITASLDAGSDVEALYSGGTTTVRIYRSLANVEYPGSTVRANLSNPSDGSIVGSNENQGVPADGSECTVVVDMAGFSNGDRFNMIAEAL